MPGIDRRSAVLRALGHEPLLQRSNGPLRRRKGIYPVHVYMDVRRQYRRPNGWRFFPGDHAFRIVSLRTPDGELDPGRWEAVFDLTLMSAGDLYATAVDPLTLARYGHFASAELPWEKLQI